MKISEKIEIDLKSATLNKDEPLKATLRNIKAKFLEAIKNNKNQSLDESNEMKILDKMIKDREKSIDMCAGKNERGDLIANNERREIEVIKTYLPEKPEQLSSEELDTVVRSIIETGNYTSVKDMGKIITDFSSKYPGQDKRLVSEKIKSLLS
jgi:uncharacterized protein YqeY